MCTNRMFTKKKQKNNWDGELEQQELDEILNALGVGRRGEWERERVAMWGSSRNGFCKALAVGINAGCRVKGVFRGKRTNTWWRFTEELFRSASNAPLNSTSALQPRLTQLLHPQHWCLQPEDVSCRNLSVTAIDFWVKMCVKMWSCFRSGQWHTDLDVHVVWENKQSSVVLMETQICNYVRLRDHW